MTAPEGFTPEAANAAVEVTLRCPMEPRAERSKFTAEALLAALEDTFGVYSPDADREALQRKRDEFREALRRKRDELEGGAAA